MRCLPLTKWYFPPVPEPQGEAGFMDQFTYESDSGYTVAPAYVAPCCIDAPTDMYIGGGAEATW